MFSKLKRRLTVWYLLVLALVLLGYGVATFFTVQAFLLGELDEANDHALATMMASFEERRRPLDSLAHELAELHLDRGEHVALLDAKGRILFERGVSLKPEPPFTFGSSSYEGNVSVRLLVIPLSKGHDLLGYLRLGRSLSGTYRELQVLGGVLAAMGPLGLLLAWLGGTWLANKAVRPVEMAMERERQFTRDASHELRTPIAVLQAHSDLLEANPGFPEALRPKLQVIRETCRKMGSLVAQMLTLGRLDVGLGDQALRFSFADLLEEEIEALRPLAETRGIRLDLELLDDQAQVVGDPAALAQVLRNLLDNALRYTPSPGQVRVTLERTGDTLHLSVADSGPGIPPAEREAIFERFQRLEHGRRVNPEGSGLGLAIARAIVVAHGGKLSISAKGNQGAVFTVQLPVV